MFNSDELKNLEVSVSMEERQPDGLIIVETNDLFTQRPTWRLGRRRETLVRYWLEKKSKKLRAGCCDSPDASILVGLEFVTASERGGRQVW